MSKLSLSAAEAETKPVPTFARMETCSCIVRLGGDVRNEVPVKDITPAELLLLRAIHGGADTVVGAKVDGYSPLSATGERMRLLNKYARHSKVIVEMFPGLAPQFPLTIAEAEEFAAQELSAGEAEMAGDPLEA